MGYDTRKYCHGPSDLPDTDHYAVIERTSVYIPGDERSRTNPGHGYPESTEHYIQYISFTNKEEWESYINELENPKYGSKKSYVAVFVKRANVNSHMKVNISV